MAAIDCTDGGKGGGGWQEVGVGGCGGGAVRQADRRMAAKTDKRAIGRWTG